MILTVTSAVILIFAKNVVAGTTTTMGGGGGLGVGIGGPAQINFVLAGTGEFFFSFSSVFNPFVFNGWMCVFVCFVRPMIVSLGCGNFAEKEKEFFNLHAGKDF